MTAEIALAACSQSPALEGFAKVISSRPLPSCRTAVESGSSGGPCLQKFLSGTHSSFPLCSCGLADGSRVLKTWALPWVGEGLSTSLPQAPASEHPVARTSYQHHRKYKRATPDSSARLLEAWSAFSRPLALCPCLSSVGPLSFLVDLGPCQLADQKEGDGEGPGLGRCRTPIFRYGFGH